MLINSNALRVFSNEQFRVRTVSDENGTIWFVAKDIAEALEYSLEGGAGTRIFGHIPTQWADRKRIVVRSENGAEQEREMLCLTEQGVYFFLGRSDKPKALSYQMWIAGEVVPSIRKTGGYALPQKTQTPFQNQVPVVLGLQDVIGATKILFETAGLEGNQLVLAMDKVGHRLLGFSMLKEADIQLVAPNQHQLLTPTQIAEILSEQIPDQKFSNRKVNLLLAEAGLQTKIGKNWEPTELGKQTGAVLMDTGKTHGDGTPVRQLKWGTPTINKLLEHIYSITSQLC